MSRRQTEKHYRQTEKHQPDTNKRHRGGTRFIICALKIDVFWKKCPCTVKSRISQLPARFCSLHVQNKYLHFKWYKNHCAHTIQTAGYTSFSTSWCIHGSFSLLLMFCLFSANTATPALCRVCVMSHALPQVGSQHSLGLDPQNRNVLKLWIKRWLNSEGDKNTNSSDGSSLKRRLSGYNNISVNIRSLHTRTETVTQQENQTSVATFPSFELYEGLWWQVYQDVERASPVDSENWKHLFIILHWSVGPWTGHQFFSLQNLLRRPWSCNELSSFLFWICVFQEFWQM